MKIVALALALSSAACGSSLDPTERRRLAETAASAADAIDIYGQLATIEGHPTTGIVTGTRASFVVDATQPSRDTGGQLTHVGSGSMVGLDAEMALTVRATRWPAEQPALETDAEEILLEGELTLVQTMTFEHATDPWPDATASRVTGRLTASGGLEGTYDVVLDICRTDWFPLSFFGPSTWGYLGTVDGEAIDNSYIDNTPTCDRG